MRGVKDTGAAFIIPHSLRGQPDGDIAVGAYHVFTSGGHPTPMAALPAAPPAIVSTLGIWMLLKAFSNGCAAMTAWKRCRMELMAFREPRVRNAQRALTIL